MLNLNRNHYIAIATLISVVVYFSFGSTQQEKIEKARQEIVQNAKADNETLGSSYDTLVKKLIETKGAININEKCINANAQTGTVVDCKTITPDEFEVILKPVTNSGTVTATIKAEPSVNDRDKVLMDRICKKSKNSPLCDNWDMFYKLKSITYSELPEGWFPIMIGISYAESHIGIDFTKDNVGGTCAGRNNWGGVKARVNKGGKVIRDQGIPDQYGCWLYKFDNLYDYWESKTNIIAYNYKGCVNSKEPIRCVSLNYVGKPNVAEQSWINNVAQFIN